MAVLCRVSYLAAATNATEEAAIYSFARELLHTVGFDEYGCVLMTRNTIPLAVCADANKAASMDVCLLDQRSTILLVLQEDKGYSDPQAQIIANAIAVYQINNQRRELRGRPARSAMVIPCITMAGTRPTFYLVPVTKELNKAVITGVRPEIGTTVLKCATVLGEPRRAGMEMPEYRRLALQRMIAFKALSKSHWEDT
jgi:hypothetical protein